MKEICLLNPGDSIDKIKKEFNNNLHFVKSNEKIFNFNYISLDEGDDDILIVRNYIPQIIYTVKKGDNIIDIMSRGYEVGQIDNIVEGDKIILSRPSTLRYVVKPLDNLELICQKFGSNKENIIALNNLKTEKLFVGQILWL